MRTRHLVAAGLAAGFGMVLAAPAAGVVRIVERKGELRDFDVRTGVVAPTAEQRDEAADLRAIVRWNRFGTPLSLVRQGGYLATGIQAPTAVEAARSWIEANQAVLGLSSTATLELANDSEMARSDGHAVLFRQRFGNLRTSRDGLITVGVTGTAAGGWKVGYVSSSLTGAESVSGAAEISAEQALAVAAQDVGLSMSILDIWNEDTGAGWKTFDVTGLEAPQRARLVAAPTPRSGVVPAWETIVLDDRVGAYAHLVDARDGSLMSRASLVDNFAAQPPLTPQVFRGDLPAVEAACAPRHGPFTVEPGAEALEVRASADNPLNDIVISLYYGATRVAGPQNAGGSTERIFYRPAGGVPPGDYFVEVCDVDDARDTPPRAPFGYTGLIGATDTSAIANPEWRVFAAYPLLSTVDADPWNLPSTDARRRWCWFAEPGCDAVVDNLASRGPWDHEQHANVPTSMTIGNNANSAESWMNILLPAPGQYRPTSLSRDYAFPWTNDWAARDCDMGTPVPGVSYDVGAAVANLFVMHNRMHDWAYFLGFTEENWNAQAHNFGRTVPGRENDPLLGNAQSGAVAGGPPTYAGRDNANMVTLPDGITPVTNMYLWQPLQAAFYAPCVDGDYDMAVIAHEYTHMIENRMIGKGFTRSGHHAGAMGESWSDLFAMEYLTENGFVPVADENPFATGAYVTGNKIRGIRNYAMNFPSSGGAPEPGIYPRINPLNLSNIGYDIVGPQVHADGEIWSATNYDIRQLLAEKYGASFPAGDAGLQRRCAAGVLPADACPGNRRWVQLLFDAFLLMPTNPSMLDARDAILAADVMRFGGANQSELWLAFARRGLGQNAFATNGLGRDPMTGAELDSNPLPDFESPRHGSATVTFDVVSADDVGVTVPARIYVGHYEARVSPVADSDPATPAAGAPGRTDNLDNVARFAPGTYEFTANAPGYGHVRFRRTFTADTAPTVIIGMPSNWASKARGAVASGDVALASAADETPERLTAKLQELIDDTETTNWERMRAVDAAGNVSVEGTGVTVDLAGDVPRTINRLQVSAMLLPGQNRFTALRQFAIAACNATAGANCATDAGFTTVFTSAPDAFPSEAPRPVAPDLIVRSFGIPTTMATHLRLVVRTSQCTGGPEFQGDQDADPLNNPDCDSRAGTPTAPTSFAGVRAAELQAFTSAVQVGGPPAVAPPPPPAPPPTVAPVRRCVVPNLRGRTLTAARRILRQRNCRLGNVTRTFSARVRVGRIVRQSPRPGATRPAAARVRVVVSLGRRAKVSAALTGRP